MNRNIPEELESTCYKRMIAGIAMFLIFVAVWSGFDFSFSVPPLVISVFFFITSLRISSIATKGTYWVLEGVCIKVTIKRHFPGGKRIDSFLVKAKDGTVYRFHTGSGSEWLIENIGLKVYIANDQNVYTDGNVKVVGEYLALCEDQGKRSDDLQSTIPPHS